MKKIVILSAVSALAHSAGSFGLSFNDPLVEAKTFNLGNMAADAPADEFAANISDAINAASLTNSGSTIRAASIGNMLVLHMVVDDVVNVASLRPTLTSTQASMTLSDAVTETTEINYTAPAVQGPTTAAQLQLIVIGAVLGAAVK